MLGAGSHRVCGGDVSLEGAWGLFVLPPPSPTIYGVFWPPERLKTGRARPTSTTQPRGGNFALRCGNLSPLVMSVSFDALTLIAGKLLCSGLCYKKSALSFSAGGESCRDADIPRRASVIVLEGLKRRGFHAPFIDFKTSQKGRLWGVFGVPSLCRN
jgi:hypothetical protein